MAQWHDASGRANARPDALTARRGPDRLVTGGVLADGRRFYTRSDRTGDDWATVFLAGDADAGGALNLMASSIRPGPPLAWDLPAGGRLSALVSETATLFDPAGEEGSTAGPGAVALPRGASSPPAPAPASTSATACW